MEANRIEKEYDVEAGRIRTRQQIERMYTVSDGRIESPGKFEGEMLYVPFYWDLFLEGMADFEDGGACRFVVSKEDRQMFPELGNRKRVTLMLRGDGFVMEL